MRTKGNKHKRWSLRKKYVLIVMILTVVPLLVSYAIFISDKIRTSENYIKEDLKEIADQVASSSMVQDYLHQRVCDYFLQDYAQELVDGLENVDLMVIADQTGKKYSHPDRSQVGQIFIGEDKVQVLEKGESYYSLQEGSMGLSFRYFRPVFKGSEQVGFIMVGKYEQTISQINGNILRQYLLLLVIVLLVTFIIVTCFAFKLKKTILDMEPEEIAALYLQKDSLLNSVREGIILFDSTHEIQEENERAKEQLAYLKEESLMESLAEYLEKKKEVRMQEFMIGGQKFLINIKPLYQADSYLGAVVTLIDKEEIHEVAKEIMGIEERNKNLRATVHEFKNNLHVLLGLLQLEEYEEAKEYILDIQKIKTHRIEQFSNIKDPYLRAMLMSRSIMAEEKQVEMQLSGSSEVMESHGYIDENDLITILGNLLENAFEACSNSGKREKQVKILLLEDEWNIKIEVSDNGEAISEGVKNCLFDLGVSSKGEGRGTGLYLLKKRLDIYHGEIRIKEEKGEKTFSVVIPKGVKNE